MSTEYGVLALLGVLSLKIVVLSLRFYFSLNFKTSSDYFRLGRCHFLYYV